MHISAVFDGDPIDEQAWIAPVLEASGAESHYVRSHATELFSDLPLVVWHQDEPMVSSGPYAQYQVMEPRGAAGPRCCSTAKVGTSCWLATCHTTTSTCASSSLEEGTVRPRARLSPPATCSGLWCAAASPTAEEPSTRLCSAGRRCRDSRLLPGVRTRGPTAISRLACCRT